MPTHVPEHRAARRPQALRRQHRIAIGAIDPADDGLGSHSLTSDMIIIERMSDVGPEVFAEIDYGIVFNEAKWSGPARIKRIQILAAAQSIDVPKVLLIDHDFSERLQ